MSTHAWHAETALLDAYVAGSLAAWEAASVEQHVTVCERCRIAIAPHVAHPDLERAWSGVRSAVERPPAHPAPRARCLPSLPLRSPSIHLLHLSMRLRGDENATDASGGCGGSRTPRQ